MGNVIILAILLVMVVLAVNSGRKHFKGSGGCCGDGEERPANCQAKCNTDLRINSTGER